MSFNMLRSMVVTFIAIIFIGVIVNIVFDACAGRGVFPTAHVQGTVAQIIPEYDKNGTDYLVQMVGVDGHTYNTVYSYRYNLPIVGQKVDIEYINSTNYFIGNHVVSVH